jgi:hypothetical protein
MVRNLLLLTIGLLLTLGSARASIYTYDFTIAFNFGPEAGAVGTGQVTYDTSLVRQYGPGGFILTAPNGLGMLSLNIDVLGTTLTLADAIGTPQQPVLYLNSLLAPHSLWGAWGSTTTTDAPAFLFGGGGPGSIALSYETATHSVSTSGPNDLGEVGWEDTPGPGNVQSTALITYTPVAVPEPSSSVLCLAALGLFSSIPAFFRRAETRNTGSLRRNEHP